MQRSGRIALVAHCVLNVNSRVDGLAGYAGMHPAVEELRKRGVALIQMDCPEVAAYGLARPPLTRDEYDTRDFASRCARIGSEVMEKVEPYLRYRGSRVLVLGIEGSPSCGVAITNVRNQAGESVRVEGEGVFTRELRAVLEPLRPLYIGLDRRDVDGGVAACRTALDTLGWSPINDV